LSLDKTTLTHMCAVGLGVAITVITKTTKL